MPRLPLLQLLIDLIRRPFDNQGLTRSWSIGTTLGINLACTNTQTSHFSVQLFLIFCTLLPARAPSGGVLKGAHLNG